MNNKTSKNNPVLGAMETGMRETSDGNMDTLAQNNIQLLPKVNTGKIRKHFSKYNTITAKEFSELSGALRNESEHLLNELSNNGTLEKLITKNGAIWKLG